MKRIAVAPGIYKDHKGEFWSRPTIRHKRTWRKIYAKTLEEAEKENAPYEEIRKIRREQKTFLDVAHEPGGDLTHLPGCLYEYSLMVKMFRPPKIERGIYFLMNGKHCVYVGKAEECVLTRVFQHRLNKDFDKVFYIPFDGDLDRPERHFIALLKPKHNSKEVEGFVEKPFATHDQIKRLREKTQERIIKACMKCGDSVDVATKKAKYLLKGKDFDPGLLSDEFSLEESLEQLKT